MTSSRRPGLAHVVAVSAVSRVLLRRARCATQTLTFSSRIVTSLHAQPRNINVYDRRELFRDCNRVSLVRVPSALPIGRNSDIWRRTERDDNALR